MEVHAPPRLEDPDSHKEPCRVACTSYEELLCSCCSSYDIQLGLNTLASREDEAPSTVLYCDSGRTSLDVNDQCNGLHEQGSCWGGPMNQQAADARQLLRSAMLCELETHPMAGPGTAQAQAMRPTAVAWVVQIVQQWRAEQETLFLAVSYLDRFLGLTQEVLATEGLQLVTLACLCLAAKQTEVQRPTAAEWAWLVRGCAAGSKEQVARMELVVMDHLDWRAMAPTAWCFLHLFCYGLGTCSVQSICMAAYLLELALFDSSCLHLSYSSLAAAALLLGHAYVEQRAYEAGSTLDPLQPAALMMLAPELDMQQVKAACRVLAHLHQAACAGEGQATGDTLLWGLQLARAKYATAVWHGVGGWTQPVQCGPLLALL